MSEISSIDDLLAGVGNSQQATTPEHKDKIEKQEKKPVEELDEGDDGHTNYDDDDEQDDQGDDQADDEADDETESDEDADDKKKVDTDDQDDGDVDEYGNKKERMSKGMKERLDRKEKQHQKEIEERDRELLNLRQQLADKGASKEVQQAVKDFKFDPNDEVSWEQQLSEFVKATVTNMQTDAQRKQREAEEQTAHREFHQKFQKGMTRFDDFREVVGKQPIDDAMTLALRGMDDPTAFIYAASKRNPDELVRISKLKDPYARIAEMGKLEQKMRRSKPTTKAPRPLGRTREDAAAKPVEKQKKDTSGDDLLASADAKRLKTVRNRHNANR